MLAGRLKTNSSIFKNTFLPCLKANATKNVLYKIKVFLQVFMWDPFMFSRKHGEQGGRQMHHNQLRV